MLIKFCFFVVQNTKGEFRVNMVVSPRFDRGLPDEDRSNALGSVERSLYQIHHATAHPVINQAIYLYTSTVYRPCCGAITVGNIRLSPAISVVIWIE